jgi:hypothetical protein
MNDLSHYRALRSRMRPGDPLYFSGTGLISGAIKLVSGSQLSHMAIIVQGAHGDREVEIVESTTEPKNGVQRCFLSDRIANYDEGGRIWWPPLAEDVRQDINWFKFWEFVGKTVDRVGYDEPGLGGFIWRSIPIIGPRIAQRENQREMVCSAYGEALLEYAGALRGINSSKMTPQDMAEMRIHAGIHQLHGKPAEIRRFNTV